MRLLYLFLGYWILMILPAQGQEFKSTKYIDSLIHETTIAAEDSQKVALFGRLYEKLMNRDPELSFEYAKKEFKLAKNIDFKKGVASSQLHIADYYKNKGILDSARYYFERSAKNFKKIGSIKGELFVNHSLAGFEKSLGHYENALRYGYKNIEIYNQRDTVSNDLEKTFNLIGAEYHLIGGIHMELGNYKIALTETLKALDFFEQKKDSVRKADALLQLGSIEYLLENNDTSINYHQEALDIYRSFDDHLYKIYSLNGIGENYLELKKPNEAKLNFEKALSIAKTIANPEVEATSLVNIGTAYEQLNDLDNANTFLRNGLVIHEKLEYKKSISTDLNALTTIETKRKNYKNALKLLERSIAISKEIGAKDNLKEAYQYRSAVYEKVNLPGKALKDFKAFKKLNDSIFNITKSQQIEELRTIYETEKKEQEIVLQKNEIELLEQKAAINNLQRILLGFGLILSLLLFGLGYYGLRQKMRRNKLEKEKVEAELAFKKKELTTHALHLAKKNELLEGLKQKAEELKSSKNSSNGYQQLIRTINFDLQDENNWENFARYFEQVHKNFNRDIKQKYPALTPNELRLMALLKMNLSSKEIANILNISQEGVKKARYRLRKKLAITTEDSLEDLVISI